GATRAVAQSGRGDGRRESRAGTAGRTAGIARRIVRVSRLTGNRADGRNAARELVQVRLPDDHGAGVTQLPDLERVAFGRETRQGDRSAGRRQIARVVIVLDDDRNAVQRSANATGGAFV